MRLTSRIILTVLEAIQICCRSCVNLRLQIAPKKKKSHGVRSGDRGGHSTGWLRAITQFQNNSCNLSLTMILRCGWAPSCVHQRRLNWPFRYRRNRANSESINGTTSLLTMSRYISPWRFHGKRMVQQHLHFLSVQTHTVSFCLTSFFSQMQSQEAFGHEEHIFPTL